MIPSKENRPVHPKPFETGKRLDSLDAYRGLTMLLLAFTVPNYDWAIRIANSYPNSFAVQALMRQFEHVEWQGIVLWDMIQPSFMFMVGLSLVYSCNARSRRGQSYSRMFVHAIFRSAFLILLGVFLRSLDTDRTNWTFEDVVTQIGLGYVPLFLLWRRHWTIQLGTIVALLAGAWLLFALWPVDTSVTQVPAASENSSLTGFFAHWNKSGNPAQFVDQWFLNLFPRDMPFVANEGGYYTLNFIPSLATMIFGLLAGNVLTGEATANAKLRTLIQWSLGTIVVGGLLHLAGICPIVKKIWTPSFALVSSGLCFGVLALLYYFVDIQGWRRFAFPARIVGMNSMAMYCMIWMLPVWLANNLQTHLGDHVFSLAGTIYQPLFVNLAVGGCLWLICWWMYKRQIFLRI